MFFPVFIFNHHQCFSVDFVEFINMFLITYTPRSANFTGDVYACMDIEPTVIKATSQTVFYEHQVYTTVTKPYIHGHTWSYMHWF